MEMCSVTGCTKTANRQAHTLCEAHYYRQRRYGNVLTNLRPELGMTEAERFWAKVQKSEGCWLWTARKNNGYGSFSLTDSNATVFAHRWAYQSIVGPVPEGTELDHLCRTRACVRPDHLEPVAHRENVLRGEGLAAKQARKTHCPKGHEYTSENTRRYAGRRYCRQCGRERYVPRK